MEQNDMMYDRLLALAIEHMHDSKSFESANELAQWLINNADINWDGKVDFPLPDGMYVHPKHEMIIRSISIDAYQISPRFVENVWDNYKTE